jgi:spore germination protein YaaH
LSTPSHSPTATAKAFSTQSAAAPRSKEIVFAYYVPYDATSWISLQANADHIDYVAPQWVYIDACGNVGSRDDRTLIAFARSKGIRILPSLLTSDGNLNHRLLTDEASVSRAVQQIVSYVVEEGYDGLDLDLEGVNATDRQAYTDFVKKLSPALRSKGKMLTAAIPAKTFDATTGWAGAYEYAAIAPYFDLIVIMTYEYSSPTGKPGSTAPYDWVEKVISYVTSQIPPEKVLVGIAFYGYDWNVTSEGRARALRYSQGQALAEHFGATIGLDPTTKSATFSYVMNRGQSTPPDEAVPALNHQITTRSQPPCPYTPPTPTPRRTPPPPTATPAPVQQHVVWLEDARSVAARLAIVGKYGAAGIGTWRLGQEDPATWPAFANWRKPAK